jgi:hypothetical protein
MEDLCLDSFNMHGWFWVSWIFCPVSYLMTQAFGLKQVVSQLPLSRSLQLVCLVLRALACSLCLALALPVFLITTLCAHASKEEV